MHHNPQAGNGIDQNITGKKHQETKKGKASSMMMTVKAMGHQDQLKRCGSVKKIGYIHIQVLRVREEDSHLGKDIGERLSAVKDHVKKVNGVYAPFLENNDLEFPQVDVQVMLFSRPILPCSPLGGSKTSSVRAHK